MAGETVNLTLIQDPIEACASLGGGNLMKGLIILKNQLARLKKSWNNIAWRHGRDTVGADTLWSITWKLYQSILLIGLVYINSASSTGTITDIKVNGKPIAGIESSSSLATNPLVSTVMLADNVGWLVTIPAQSDLTIEGIAVNADAVDIFWYGWDLDLEVA